MSNINWACFDCRVTVRRPAEQSGKVSCPTCGEACFPLGYRIPVPPKDRKREWEDLRDQLVRERAEREQEASEEAVRRRHELEREIDRLERLPANEGRMRAIRLLRRRLGEQ